MEIFLSLVLRIPAVVIAITLHQFVYALTSYKLGDSLPKTQGRLTLNPLKHIEPIGLIIMFITGYGWGQPVNTNSSYYKNKKTDSILVALSGIVANLICAVLFSAIIKIMLLFNLATGTALTFLYRALAYIIQYNIIMAVFNLIPVYPLDGYKIMMTLVKPNTYFKIVQYEKILQMILMLLIFLGAADYVIMPIVDWIYSLLV